MHVQRIIDEAYEFVNKVYVPDVLAIGSFYKDWLHGGGLNNYLVYGDFAKGGDIRDVSKYRIPRGVILNGNLNEILDVDPRDPNQVQEYVDHSWYTYDGKGTGGRHPWEGETTLNIAVQKHRTKT